MQVLHNILFLFLRESGGVCVADEGMVPAADEAVLDAVAETKTAAEDVGFEEEPELNILSQNVSILQQQNKLRT